VVGASRQRQERRQNVATTEPKHRRQQLGVQQFPATAWLQCFALIQPLRPNTLINVTM
jgi:hypothetical protein